MTQAAAYFRLGKFHIYEHWLPVLVAFSALPNATAAGVRAAAAIMLSGACAAFIAAAGSALDDYQGLRDGIDQLTYDPANKDRDIRTKPLLSGELPAQRALTFALAITIAGAAAFAMAVTVGPYAPMWLWLTVALLALAATQYSFGLKLSYHGFGEFVLALGNGATLVIPYMLVTGSLPAFVAVQAILLMLWMAQITLCSGIADVDHDRAAGRGTAVAMLPDSIHVALPTLVCIASWVVVITTTATGVSTPMLPIALSPALVIQVRQLRAVATNDQWLAARRLGWRAYDVAVAGLVLVNLFAAHR